MYKKYLFRYSNITTPCSLVMYATRQNLRALPINENTKNKIKSTDKKPAVIVNSLYGKGVKLAIKIKVPHEISYDPN